MSSTGEGHCSKGRCGAQVEHAVGHVTVPTTSTHQTLAGLPGLVLGDTTNEQSKPVTMVTIPSLPTIGYPVVVTIQTGDHPIRVTTDLPTPPLLFFTGVRISWPYSLAYKYKWAKKAESKKPQNLPSLSLSLPSPLPPPLSLSFPPSPSSHWYLQPEQQLHTDSLGWLRQLTGIARETEHPNVFDGSGSIRGWGNVCRGGAHLAQMYRAQ